jgi:hypothetical protein
MAKKKKDKKETPKKEEMESAHAEKVEEKPSEKAETTAQEESVLSEPIEIKDYLYLMILTLEGKAWAYMDLVPHPETKKHKKDLGQAQRAIDSIDSLYKIIEADMTPEQKKDIQTRLTNLRLNFVKKE